MDFQDPGPCNSPFWIQPVFPQIMVQGISLANRYHINLVPGHPNKAQGNCAIESILDNINSRDCFPNKLPFHHHMYRLAWIKASEALSRNSDFYPGMFTDDEWKIRWDTLKKDGQYDIQYFGDLMMLGFMHCVKKDALMFDVSEHPQHGRVTVLRARSLNEHKDSDIPLVLVHYESLIPASDIDIEKTIYCATMEPFSGTRQV